MFRAFLVAVILMTTVSIAPCAIVGSFVPVTDDAGTSPPAGFVTSDLVVSTTTDWLASNLLVELSTGSIHQDALLSGIGPPSSALVGAIPSVRWDTYVTGSAGLDGGSPASAGGAVDLGGTPAGEFDGSGIDLNWFTTSTTDIGTFSVGRFTLSGDAVGTFTLRLDALGQSAPFILTGEIVNGSFVTVPEVGPILLSAIGLGGSILVRRRSQATTD